MGKTTSLQSLHSTIEPHSATAAHMRQGCGTLTLAFVITPPLRQKWYLLFLQLFSILILSGMLLLKMLN